MNNPFTLSFGKKPIQYVSRITQTNHVIETFQSEYASDQIFMITGVRGVGKTVFMTNVASELRQDEDWIVVELNSLRDLLQALAAKLYSIPGLHEQFIKAKLDFSAFGLGVSIENTAPVTDIEDVISRMLEQIKKAGKRLLVTIDEVSKSEYMRIFASAFQIFMRQDYPIYLLMTGLYENISALQDDASLTFLYRAPKLLLEPLNYTAVQAQYMDIFQIDEAAAEEMTSLTKGYPFAFQVLGYLYWENRKEKTISEILPEYDQYLEEYVYSKIWSELSELDRKIMLEIASGKDNRVKNIRDNLGMTSRLFSVYRDRLKRKGVLDTREYGKVSMSLPRMEEFVLRQQMYGL
jgi:hypothetical protein